MFIEMKPSIAKKATQRTHAVEMVLNNGQDTRILTIGVSERFEKSGVKGFVRMHNPDMIKVMITID